MSVSISAFYRDESGELHWLDEERPGAHVGGVQSYIHSFYGSEAFKKRGCAILTRMPEGDVFAEGAKELAALESEVNRLLADLPALAAELGWPGAQGEDNYGYRLRNILIAIEQARAHPSGRGGVSIG